MNPNPIEVEGGSRGKGRECRLACRPQSNAVIRPAPPRPAPPPDAPPDAHFWTWMSSLFVCLLGSSDEQSDNRVGPHPMRPSGSPHPHQTHSKIPLLMPSIQSPNPDAQPDVTLQLLPSTSSPQNRLQSDPQKNPLSEPRPDAPTKSLSSELPVDISPTTEDSLQTPL